jgi:hypothetical protein
MTEIYQNQVARLKHTIQAQDVMLFQCMKYIQAIKAEVDQCVKCRRISQSVYAERPPDIQKLAKLPICFGSYRIVDHGKIKNVEMRGDYDCRIIILKNTETNLITLDIDALEDLAELREIRFHFVKKYVPGINTTIHLVNVGEPMAYIDFIYWCSQRRIRLSMTIGGEAVAVDWKYVFM